MGRRKKSSKKVIKKEKLKVATVFKCPFCAHDQSVECEIDREKNIGVVECRVCHVSYQMVTNALTEPIDVYHEWIDECEAVGDAEADDDGDGYPPLDHDDAIEGEA